MLKDAALVRRALAPIGAVVRYHGLLTSAQHAAYVRALDPFQRAVPMALADVRGMLAFLNACGASAVRVERGFHAPTRGLDWTLAFDTAWSSAFARSLAS
jgi:hypothetical protein